MKKYKTVFWFIWLAIVAVGPFTISKTVIFSKVFADYGLTLSFFQRLTGTILFSLLFIQLFLGAHMVKLTQKFGPWIFKVHTIQGPAIYLLSLIHPLFLFALRFKIFHVIDPFYIYTQVCFLCKNKTEFLYTFGRLALWFLTIAGFAALFRNSGSWMRVNWRKLHILNYVVFFFVAIHGFFGGSDFGVTPFNYFFFGSVAIVFATIILKIFPRKTT